VDYIAKPYRNPSSWRGCAPVGTQAARDWLRDQNAYLEAEVARRVAENLSIQEASNRELARLNRQNELILISVGEGIYGVDTAASSTSSIPPQPPFWAIRGMICWGRRPMQPCFTVNRTAALIGVRIARCIFP